MKVRIIYQSGTGNTHRVAKAIGSGFEAHEHDVELSLVKDCDPELADDCDILGIGTAVYTWKHSEAVNDFLERVPDLYVKPAFLFISHGANYGNTFRYMYDLLAKRRAKLLAVHSCKGEMSYPVFRSRPLGTFNAERPSERDLDRARAFADRVLEEYDGFIKDPSAYKGMVPEMRRDVFYYLSKTVPFGKMTRVTGTKRIDRSKCTRCGTCVEHCPSGCLVMEEDGPVFTSGCIGCCACYNLCPENAVTSRLFGDRPRYRGRWDK